MIDPKLVPTVWFDGRKTNLLQTMSKTIVLCCVAYDERYTIFPYRAFFTWAMPSNTHTHKLITINAISSDTTNRIWVSYIYCIEKKKSKYYWVGAGFPNDWPFHAGRHFNFTLMSITNCKHKHKPFALWQMENILYWFDSYADHFACNSIWTFCDFVNVLKFIRH